MEPPSSPESPSSPPSRRRLTLLLAVLAALLVALVWEIRWYRAQQPSPQPPPPIPMPNFEKYLAQDPQEGSTIQLPEKADLNDGKWNRKARYLVLLFSSSCSACDQKMLQEWRLWLKKYRQATLLAVTPDRPGNRKEWEEAHQVWLPVVFDEGNVLKSACNAFFTPRAYLLDQQGRLLFLQVDRSKFPGEEIGRILERETKATTERPL